MGQTSSNGSGVEPVAPSKSHYELLDIPQTATDDEIKKAYRRRALELHPDRNYGKEEAATALFAEIQAAYSVLSDPQERAWYDAHQSEFVSDGSNGDGAVHYERSVKVTTAEDIRAMCASRSSAYSDFSDSPNGFFTSVRELFDRLAMEENIAAANSGYDPTDYPSFGASNDEFQDVVKSFYSVWGGFSTAKTFAWKDQYRASSEYDRRTRRAMEKENQKLRDEAVREFNDAIRALVLFVRRRDPRYITTATTDAERQKSLRDAAAAQAARARKANADKLAEQAVPDWARSRGDQEGDDYATDDPEEEEEEEEDEEPEIWECVVCSKTFKSEGQFDAHERSKKHKQAVGRLKREMRHQDVELGLDEKTDGTPIPPTIKDLDNEDDTPEEDLDNLTLEEDDLVPERHNSRQEITPEPEAVKDLHSSSEDNDDTYAPRSAIESRILGSAVIPSEAASGLGTPLSNLSDAESGTSASTPSSVPGKLGKAKAKRAKRLAKEAAQKSSAASGADDIELECVACKDTFSSKNKLFDHIKKTGHARPVAQSTSNKRK